MAAAAAAAAVAAAADAVEAQKVLRFHNHPIKDESYIPPNRRESSMGPHQPLGGLYCSRYYPVAFYTNQKILCEAKQVVFYLR